MRESKIEKYLRTEIAKLGGWMEKHVSPGTRGAPDNIVWWPEDKLSTIWHNGRDLYVNIPWSELIETKAPGGVYQPLQGRDHARRRKMGFQVHVIWTMEQAERYLKSRGKK